MTLLVLAVELESWIFNFVFLVNTELFIADSREKTNIEEFELYVFYFMQISFGTALYARSLHSYASSADY